MRIANGWTELDVPRVAHLSIREADKLLAAPKNGTPGTEVYDPQTPRQLVLANGQQRSLEGALSEIDGLCRGLRDVKMPMAFACLTEDDRMTWARLVGSGRWCHSGSLGRSSSGRIGWGRWRRSRAYNARNTAFRPRDTLPGVPSRPMTEDFTVATSLLLEQEDEAF